MMPAPLAGLTVLEIGQYMAAPFAAMQLADLGARVIKIEHPGVPEAMRMAGPFLEGEDGERHSSPFVRLNRNKESIRLDLKSEAGRRALLRLAETADVLVENLRPGALRAIGLGPDEVRAVNPGLVYASVSGFGQDGPLAGLPGLDIMAQARGGLMSITGQPDGDPVKVGVPICDLVSGLYTAMAVLAALRHRDADPQRGGQFVDVSLLEAGVSLAVWEAGRYFATGELPRPLGSAHQAQAPYQALRCSDGWATIGAVTDKSWAATCGVLGLPETIRDDPRYAGASGRHQHREELIPVLEAVTEKWTQDELVAALRAESVPCAPINDYAQVFTDDHLSQREFFWDAPHPVLGEVRQLGSPMRLSGTPTRRDGAGPLPGAHTREVLRAAGYPDTEIDAMIRAGEAG
ncbi:formyl-CoA transferase [Pseudonocardia eucalypti]|uniref:CoA transferase n=1 Tax=Pseudonocardia eucalypti TaxID=648755 RepID=UPI0016164000|nr:formyl-CoA transferase [Pseudonocardia eucalypti]